MLTYSLILGFLAWALAGIAIAARGRKKGFLMWWSFLCAAVSALWQFFGIQARAAAGDWAGIEDTSRAVIIGLAVMFAVTFLLNLIALTRDKRKA